MSPVEQTNILLDRYGPSVSVKKAAKIAGMDPSTAYKLIKRGQFPCHRNGKRLKVFIPKLVAWMDAGGAEQYEPGPAPRAPRPHRRGGGVDLSAWRAAMQSA